VTVRGYDGSVRRTYAATPTNPGRTYHSSAVTPDGKHLVEAGARIVIRDAETGAVVRSIAHPEPQTAKRSCDVNQAWGDSGVAVRCSDTDGIGNEDTYRVGFDGKASKVGTMRTEVWPTSAGVVYDAHGGEVAPNWMLRTPEGTRELPLDHRTDVTGSEQGRVYVLSSPYEPRRAARCSPTTSAPASARPWPAPRRPEAVSSPTPSRLTAPSSRSAQVGSKQEDDHLPSARHAVGR
jgi:hypothetical protein